MFYPAGLLDLKDISENQINNLFQISKEIKEAHLAFQKTKYSQKRETPQFHGLTAALLFFEPSTRTRFSFETACARLGLHPLVLSGVEGTSLSKGESFEDTILNIQAMNPEIFIIRCGDNSALRDMAEKMKRPVINAGWGLQGHPTQALLDAFCWREQIGDLRGRRLLIIGDIKHSRVAASHVELSRILGYEVACCGPSDFMPESDRFHKFKSLEEGIAWAHAIMVLRVQLERHAQKISLDSYKVHYQIGKEWLQKMPESMCIFHPGPVNYGIELDQAVSVDPRSQFMNQVEHGVWLRQALLQNILGGVK
ncbi:MAG: aspartate carbamoyltransferase catalytic subunit [Bdellovibrionaceae bacterium]|nr:aspartate carbamoyltransferase catalytic subunit [Pseudobdellovibrionaceae bacterium]